MSNVLGIIAEYNPFHNGHLYHLIESKRVTNADYTIAVMSGNFVQRGNVSIVDKWTKAEMAVLNGVDLVIELPTTYSISSAEKFAEGAVKILNSLKVVNNISFGSETCDLETLNKFADVLYREPPEFVSVLNHELSKGLSFPKARENALLIYLNDVRKYANVLSSPNNILGIEYLKALKKLKSKITPIAIKREGTSYNDKGISGNFASATAIRDMIMNRDTKDLKKVLPLASYNVFANSLKQGEYVTDLSTFEKQIMYNLRKMSIEEIAALPDVSEGLENSIKDVANSCNTKDEFMNAIKSKRYARNKISKDINIFFIRNH